MVVATQRADFRDENFYRQLLAYTLNGKNFEGSGYGRRSGIAVPAFALYSDRVPIGDFRVAKQMVDFCYETKKWHLSIFAIELYRI